MIKNQLQKSNITGFVYERPDKKRNPTSNQKKQMSDLLTSMKEELKGYTKEEMTEDNFDVQLEISRLENEIEDLTQAIKRNA